MNINKLSVHQTLKDLLLYAFITPRHRAKDSNPKGRSTQSSVEAYQRDKTLFNGFLMICKWQQGQFQMVRGPVGIYEGQQKEQGQPSAKSGANDRFSGRALRRLVIIHYHAKIAQVL